ncbi:TonB-dependent hemoglobin/transferrin/lactoferrin family receptor [Shewanella sp. SNU WT4]|uniref:TonB-dependent hemoglobin/transferrin/lactoferrin family receptor n=1 Tax=Shewanella sp. SNU WT4 TaxID=2590015 RepID=UPI00112E9C16|nr:TonB-dependent hemoglobin/transferrin/lactoferrin family receptor [Shewanella sp. SNU WT4]QDF66164.1 TonB-dependent hemoglobin/transferrin/lactoferrin family receptor [Shewanella sp. SNU WT4]
MSVKPLTLAVLAGLNLIPLAHATSPNQTLTEVLVSASRIEEQASDSSRSVAVIDEQEIAVTQPQSVPQALAGAANVNVTNGPRASSQAVEIRGIGGDRVLQTVDGTRQNTSSGHRGTYFLDPEMLKSIEVIRGPASSLWGSGAIGGVVAQNTRSAKDFLEDEQSFGGYIKQGYEANGDRTKTSGALFGQDDAWDWLVNGAYFDGNNIDLGNGQQLQHSGNNGYSSMAKLGWQANDLNRLQLTGRVNQINELVPSNPGADVGRSVPLVQRNTDDKHLSLDYQFQSSSSALLDGNAKLYYNQAKYDEQRIALKQTDNTDYQTLGFSLVNRSRFGELAFIYGLDGYQDKLSTVRDDSGQVGQRPDDIDANAKVWGSFIQADIPLLEHVTLSPALRYDSFNNTSDSLDLSSRDDKWSPSVGLTWKTAQWLTLSARYDQAFRAPSMTEMFSTGSHYCIPSIPGFLPNGLCNRFKINPDLQAETARNKELKAQVQLSELMGDDDLSLSLNLFRNDIDDFIIQQVENPLMGIPGFEQTTTWNNVQDAKLQGFEFNARYRIEQTHLSLDYGQTQGTDNATGEYLESIPANKLTIDLSQGLWSNDVTLGTRYMYTASQNKLPSTSSHTDFDAYGLWDVYVAWEPSSGSLNGLRLDAGIDNLTDEYYRQAWQTLYSQGRNFKLSARFTF